MSLRQAVCNLRRDFNRLSHRQQSRDKQFAQRLPFYQLHRNVMIGTVLSELVDRNDIGMVEGRCRASFLFEPLPPFIVFGECGRQKFNRHNAIKPGVPRPVNFAHATCAQRSNNFKGTEPAAWSEGHSWPQLYPNLFSVTSSHHLNLRCNTLQMKVMYPAHRISYAHR